MKIIIDEAHSAKLQAAIDVAQGKAKVRTIDAGDIILECERVGNRLDIPKSHMDGISFSADINAQNFPSAYKYIPASTIFNAQYHGGKWYLVGVSRETTRRAGHGVQVKLTDVARESVLDRISQY